VKDKGLAIFRLPIEKIAFMKEHSKDFRDEPDLSSRSYFNQLAGKESERSTILLPEKIGVRVVERRQH